MPTINCHWPARGSVDSVIVHEKRSATTTSNQRGPPLKFPPFHKNTLAHRSWDAREHTGRIKVLLSEQLAGGSSSLQETHSGIVNDIVCFSFQHAPQGKQQSVPDVYLVLHFHVIDLTQTEILEQAGIAWPIRNPLYLASGVPDSYSSEPLSIHTKPHEKVTGDRVRPAMVQRYPSPFPRPNNPEPYARSNTGLPSHPSQLHKSTAAWSLRHSGRWDSSLEDSGIISGDEHMSTDSWPMKRMNSYSTGDVSMPDLLHASPVFGHNTDSWTPRNVQSQMQAAKHNDGQSSRQETGSRQVIVTLREDQLGQLVRCTRDFSHYRGRCS